MKKGFTLVELLAVLMIVAILTAVGLPQYSKVVDKSRVSEAVSMLRTIYDSSERLSGEFGYRSYEQLIAKKSAQSGYNANDYGFPRLDMFDDSKLPAGCSLGDDKTVLVCSRFSYKIAVNGYVAAKQHITGKRYGGTYILLNRRTLALSCQPDSSDTAAEACDTYGLDVNNAGVSF
ncbi:pilin [Candidatus Avelusimicrobium caledoniensis]|uniref:pilin n=1 Tax=Candidatus Avelusimicrobium caledoniensis TaxID=3416220 RepID=UPI003D1524FF